MKLKKNKNKQIMIFCVCNLVGGAKVLLLFCPEMSLLFRLKPGLYFEIYTRKL